MTYDKDLTKVPCRFDPETSSHASVFENPLSRALWMAYRTWHICGGNTIPALSSGAMRIASAIENNPEGFLGEDNKETLKTFIKMNLIRGSHQNNTFNDLDDYFDYVYPYLTGEKVATYVVKEH